MLVLRRDVNVLSARTTGVNEGYHRFFKDKLKLRFPRLHSRRLDATVYFLFDVMSEWYSMRNLQAETGAKSALTALENDCADMCDFELTQALS